MKNLFVLVVLTLVLTGKYSKCQLKGIAQVEQKNFVIPNKPKNNLMDNYDVKFYFIDITATNLNKTISGKGAIKAQVVHQPLSELVVELHSSLTVDSVLIDNVSYNFTRTNDEIHVLLTNPIEVGQYFYVEVYYHGNSAGTGIKNGQSPSWGKKVTWTLSESYHAKDWFPCKQDLNDKADSAYIFITCTNNLKAGSNGLLTNVVTLPNNMIRYEWKTYYPIDYYLISFTISEYQEYIQYAHPSNYNDSILVLHYIYDNPNYLPYFQNEINNTTTFIELLSNLYGLYPFHQEKYGHCTAPIGGGMEHQTMTTLSYFNFELIIHELGHQWFGDYVTCKTWQDIWINEGFATYTYYLGQQYLLSQSDADNWMVTVHNDVMSVPDGSIYVPFSEIYNETRIFDYRLTYEKGAAIIHTLRGIINNDSIFFALLRSFLQQYAFSTATADDFKNFASNFTGIDFTTFFDEWFYGEGYPTYSLIWNQEPNGLINFTLSQTTSVSTITPFFHLPVEIRFVGVNQDTIVRFEHQYNNQNFSLVLPFTVTQIQIDPRNYIINKVGSITTTIKLTETFNYILYPNPTSNTLIIDNINQPIDYSIFNIDGKLIFKGKTSKSIDLSTYEAGMYFIQINNDNMQKIIKN